MARKSMGKRSSIMPWGVVFLMMLVAGHHRHLGVFFNVEAMILVAGGAFLLVWSAYPWEVIRRFDSLEVIDFTGRALVRMGFLGTLFGFMIILGSPDFRSGDMELWKFCQRTVLSLDAFLYGYILSKIILAPRMEIAALRTKSTPA